MCYAIIAAEDMQYSKPSIRESIESKKNFRRKEMITLVVGSLW